MIPVRAQRIKDLFSSPRNSQFLIRNKTNGWRCNFSESECAADYHRVSDGDDYARAAYFGDRFARAFDFNQARTGG